MSNSRFAVAVHMLAFLGVAAERAEPATSDVIAWSVNTHPVVIRRDLAALREAGLVASRAGPGGGWRLARPADQITLRDVYGAVADAPLVAEPPRPAQAECEVGGRVQALFDRVFADAEAAMTGYLATVTVASLVAEVSAALGANPACRDPSRGGAGAGPAVGGTMPRACGALAD